MLPALRRFAPAWMAGVLFLAACAPRVSAPPPPPRERSWPANALREFCFHASPETIEGAFGRPDASPSANEWIYERVMVQSGADGAATPVRLRVFFKPAQEPPHAPQVSEIRFGP